MDKTKIESYKKELERERARLAREIEEEEKVENFGSDIDHDDEKTDESEESENKLAMAESLKERVNEIDAALNRIARGIYGACTQCGQAIEPKILDIAPESALCRACKEKVREGR